MLRLGLLLGFAAVFLQIAVFLQPLLPKQYQIAPVCETISQALSDSHFYEKHEQSTHHQHHLITHDSSSHVINSAVVQQHGHQNHSQTEHQHVTSHDVANHDVSVKNDLQAQSTSSSHHHDANHQCQYCTVYGNLVLPPELEIKEVLDRIQVRLFAFQKAFRHVYFVLQRLYLLPQGRAPPLFA